MNHHARLLVAATLIFAAGCAKQDWIDRTLVTENVTGTWEGTWFTGHGLLFELEQQGSTVKGSVQLTLRPGPLEGTVAGYDFRARYLDEAVVLPSHGPQD
jgi:hypothetical protein